MTVKLAGVGGSRGTERAISLCNPIGTREVWRLSLPTLAPRSGSAINWWCDFQQVTKPFWLLAVLINDVVMVICTPFTSQSQSPQTGGRRLVEFWESQLLVFCLGIFTGKHQGYMETISHSWVSSMPCKKSNVLQILRAKFRKVRFSLCLCWKLPTFSMEKAHLGPDTKY